MTAPENSPKIIVPTIGRRVHYYPAAHDDVNDHGTMNQIRAPGELQPFDAGVVFVWSDRMVNLDITDHRGLHHARTSVPLLQEGDIAPENGGYAAWMPYQAAQSRKEAAAPAALPGDSYVYPTRREEALHALVSGAAITIAAASHTSSATLIAENILAVVNKLHPLAGEQVATRVYADGTTVTGVAPLPSLSPAQQDLETEIQAKADNAPRVTPQALQDEIDSVHFFTAWQGSCGAAFDEANPDGILRPFSHGAPQELGLLTICVLVLKNGFTCIGHSACASPENFNKEIGERIARENAERQVWPLLGFRLRDELAKPALTDADAAADLAGKPRPAA